MLLSRQGSLLSVLQSHPSNIGPWRLGRTLGRGATGRVLLGVHNQTGQRAAVKVVSKLELSDDHEKGKGLPYGIEREIIVMKLLTHPNVLRLYDVWETLKALYLVLEYVEGGELFDLLVERGPLGEEEAVKYFRQIILGTAYCHALGICHRDLKPENLLLDAQLNVRLADFGMAALETSGKLLETSCGLPHYAAPEIVLGLKYHGAASDVWSCGVILFALLTGRLPFDDENIRNLLLKVQAGSFELPPELSSEARDLLACMLTVDPALRLSTADVLKHPLLTKYPIPNEDLISERLLPHPQTAYKLFGSAKNIDPQILQNLLILWHNRSEAEITQALLADGPGPEKTFYALLLRYSAEAGLQLPRKLPRLGSLFSTPKRKAPTAKNRPVLFQRRYGQRLSARLLASPSVNGSPFRLPRKSPLRLPRKRNLAARNLAHDFAAEYEANVLLPPTLPSKDNVAGHAGHAGEGLAGEGHVGEGQPEKTLEKAPLLKRASLGRRKLVRQLLTAGLRRNSITAKLLSTYARLALETDWEYMDKQTKRTLATFALLCDKIFNQEDYNNNDELLEDDEERRAREYEAMMERERRKHEAEVRARRELAKKRRKRKSLLSSRKLSITIKEDKEPEALEPVPEVPAERRALSEGVLTLADVAQIKRRSATQPVRRLTPILTRRPVLRLDPLWTQFENPEVNRAQEALEEEFHARGAEPRAPEVPVPAVPEVLEAPAAPRDRKTLIGSVHIPKVARRLSRFSQSNKRLLLLTIRSTRESYRDLNSFLDAHGEDVQEEELAEEERMPNVRTSIADRLDRVAAEIEEEPLDEASVMDFDEHLSNKRLLYHVGKEPKPEEPDYTFNEEEKRPAGPALDIKLPTTQPNAALLLLPDLKNEKTRKPRQPEPRPEKKEVRPLVDSTNVELRQKLLIFRKLSWGTKKHLDENGQLPSPANLRLNSGEGKRSGLFFRWFSGSDPALVQEYRTILPRQEMTTALYSLLNSWSNFGLKDLRKDGVGHNITGAVSSRNAFNLRSCKFRIKVNLRLAHQKSELICVKVKGLNDTAGTLFAEIRKVLEKEGVMDK